MENYTESQRLDWMFARSPRLDFDWKLAKEGDADSHWLVVWVSSKADEVVYSGKDYRECLDKAMAADEAIEAAGREEQLEEDGQ
jgi:hypothetical protein